MFLWQPKEIWIWKMQLNIEEKKYLNYRNVGFWDLNKLFNIKTHILKQGNFTLKLISICLPSEQANV